MAVLKEQHLQSDWIHLFKGVSQKIAEDNSKFSAISGIGDLKAAMSMLEAIISSHKRKDHYEDKPSAYAMYTPGKHG